MGSRTKRPPPRLIDGDDNAGEGAWRAHKASQDSVRIPKELLFQQTHHELLAREHRAFIFLQDGGHSNISSNTFGIWGEPAAVSATKQAILDWMEQSQTPPKKSSKAASFAKIVSLTPLQREREHKRWKCEVMRQRFRQNPPLETTFEAIGCFLWPVEEYRPEEILGANYEALDPIRMDCSCYVVFWRERNAFRVMGKSDDVTKGLLRIRKTCFQIAARQIPLVRMYLLRWTGTELYSHVGLRELKLPSLQNIDQVDSRPGRYRPRGEGAPSSRQDETQAQNLRTHSTLRTHALQVLKKLRWYCGSIQMRLRLGVFIMEQYKLPKSGRYELAEYEGMTRQTQFRGHVTQEIGDVRIERSALQSLQHAGRLLLPSDAMTPTLSEMKPSYTTIFTFADSAGDLRLTASWVQAQDGSIDCESNSGRWTRLDRDSGTETALLDASLVDLCSSSAWQFDILTCQEVSEQRVPPALQDFADTLKPDSTSMLRQSAERSFVLQPRPVPNLIATQQRVDYRYNLANTDYVLELSRYQDRFYARPNRPDQPSMSETPLIYEPRWRLSVFRNEWDTCFAENARLPVGTGAAWQVDDKSWFPKDLGPGVPEDGDGFAQLMEKLDAVEALVKGGQVAEADDLLTGMSVG